MQLPTRQELLDRVSRGLLKRVESPCGRLELFNYTPQCQFEGAWDNVTRQARGLIFEVSTGRCVARPFPKFFNHTEPHAVAEMPNRLPDSVSEKLDGSLGIGFVYDGEVWWCTRGAFESEQAQAAADMWSARYGNLSDFTREGTTLCVEILHPVSRVVVHYEQSELVLLAVRDVDGTDAGIATVQGLAARLGMRSALTSAPATAAKFKARADEHDDQFEGFVLRWDLPNGEPYRVKVKGAAYLATHRLLQGLTERRAADLWYAGISLPSSLSEEIRGWYAERCAEMDAASAALVESVDSVWTRVSTITDRKAFVQAVGPRSPEFRGCLARFLGKSHDYREQAYKLRFDNNSPRDCSDFESAVARQGVK